jgi:excisionase family DNA binding protein
MVSAITRSPVGPKGNGPEAFQTMEGTMSDAAKRRGLFTVEEAANELGVKPSTIRSWILRREKVAVVKIGRLVRITERSIQKLIDDNTIQPRGNK